MAAAAAVASVTPSRTTNGGTSGIGHRVGRGLHRLEREVGDRHRHVAVEPRRDVGCPADPGALGEQHFVELLGHLRVQRPVEVDALDRREVSQDLAERRVLRPRTARRASRSRTGRLPERSGAGADAPRRGP